MMNMESLEDPGWLGTGHWCWCGYLAVLTSLSEDVSRQDTGQLTLFRRVSDWHGARKAGRTHLPVVFQHKGGSRCMGTVRGGWCDGDGWGNTWRLVPWWLDLIIGALVTRCLDDGGWWWHEDGWQGWGRRSKGDSFMWRSIYLCPRVCREGWGGVDA